VHSPADPFADHPLPREPLVHCPACGSGLIYPLECSFDGQSTEIECRCPECEHIEVIVTSPLIAVVWRMRDARAAEAMAHLADALADEPSA
jgi:ribosomal protein S27E